VIRCVVRTKEKLLGAKSRLFSKCCSNFQPILKFSQLSNGPVARWCIAIFKKTTPFCSKPGRLLRIAGRNQSDNAE